MNMTTDPTAHMWLRNIWIVLVAILLVLVVNSFASAQTIVYTNQGPVVVREVRTVRPAAPIPISIQRRADELQALSEFQAFGLLSAMRPRTRVVPHQQVAVPKIVPQRTVVSPPMAPLFIDGLYVGPSPNGQWTSISHITPTINIRMIK